MLFHFAAVLLHFAHPPFMIKIEQLLHCFALDITFCCNNTFSYVTPVLVCHDVLTCILTVLLI